jgi:hypothetical protein
MSELSLRFGFASRRPIKEKETPKFNFPYLEMCPASDLKGGVSKFKLLNGAAELLKFNQEEEYNKIAYAQSEKDLNMFFLVNVTSIPETIPSEHKLNKDNSFNSSALNNRICKELNLNPKESHFFKAHPVDVDTIADFGGLNVVQLHLIPLNQTVQATIQDVEVEDVKIPTVE